MLSRLAAFVIWAAVAASVVFWSLKLWARPMAVPAQAVVVSSDSGYSGDLGRVLGVDATPSLPAEAAPAADPRFRLVGVVAPRGAQVGAPGVALIATDGRPAKAYRVGAPVEGELVLQAVRSRGASLGPRGQEPQVDLQLPALSAPAAPAAGATPRPAVMSPPRAPVAVPPPAMPHPLPPAAPPPPRSPDDNVETDPPHPDATPRPPIPPTAGGVRPPT